MSTQDPSKFQGNQKSTSSKDISPGDPMWTTGDDHSQQSFGWGYDYGDPVDFLKGDTSIGGYNSGNSSSNFGELGFEVATINTGHGEIVEIVILRQGGYNGEVDLLLEIDRDPFGTGIDPNTAIIGSGRTRVVDGFDVCEVDVDVETLNLDDPDLFWDDVNQQLRIKMQPGKRLKRIPVVVAYRTQVNHLKPARVHGKLTYRVDEYKCADMVTLGWPSMKFLTEHANCAPTGLPGTAATVVNNKTLLYTLYSLPVPSKFNEAAGGVAPIDAYTTHLVNRFDKAGRSYKVGHTYTVESQAVIRHSPWLTDATMPSCAGPTNESHKFTQYYITGGSIDYTFSSGATMTVEMDTTVADLTAAVVPVTYVVRDQATGAPLLGSDGLSAGFILDYNVSPDSGTNITDPLPPDSANADPDGANPAQILPQASVPRQGSPGNLGGSLCSCLTALSAANTVKTNYGASAVLNSAGTYKDHTTTVYDSGTNSVVHNHDVVTQALPVGESPSGWETYTLAEIGDTPDVSGGLPELDPGDPTTNPPTPGLSDIRVNDLEDHVFNYEETDPDNNSVGYGGVTNVLFDGVGIPGSFSDPITFKPKFTSPLESTTLHHFPDGGTLTNWPTSTTLSGAGYFWDIGTSNNPARGSSIVDDWIIDDATATDELYNLTNLEITNSDYVENTERLKGFYMTCYDHQNRELYLKLSPNTPEPLFEMTNLTRLSITIDKSDEYSVFKHAIYDPDVAHLSLMMRHLSATGDTYIDNDEIGKPTGRSLMTRLFGPASSVANPGYALSGSAGYTSFGCLSTDEILFLSLVEGFKANDAISLGAGQEFKAPPVFSVSEDPVERNAVAGADITATVEYFNTGSSDMVLSFEDDVQDVTPGGTVISWNYDTSATDATAGTSPNQWTVPPGKKVVAEYTYASAAAGVTRFKHQVQVDYIGFDPGIQIVDIDFTFTVT